MKKIIFLIFLLLGIGRNLPNEMLYVGGVGFPELCALMLALWLLKNRESEALLLQEIVPLRDVIIAIVLLSVFSMMSMALNAFIYGASVRDVFEICKYFYNILLMLISAYCTRKYGPLPAIGFVVGVLATGIVALLNPMNPDVMEMGAPQIFNPNVIGNALSVSIVLCSLIMLNGNLRLGSMMAISAASIAFFTFSKGTWIMSTLAVLACCIVLATTNRVSSRKISSSEKFISLFTILGLFFIAYYFRELIFNVVEAKIIATEFGASAAEGGSFAARWGMITAAFKMFMMNPLLGVGISNFEHVNHILAPELGDAFYDDDNPNSAWFYVLGCMGLPAFVCFLWIFFTCIRLFDQVPIRFASARIMYVILVTLVLFIGGNVQLEMLTATYYWVLLGILAGQNLPSRSFEPYSLKI